MRLWLDDARPLPKGYDLHVATARAAIEFLKLGNVTHLSFDYDLGMYKPSGLAVAVFIEEGACCGLIPRLSYRVHDAPKAGKEAIHKAMIKAQTCWKHREKGAFDKAV